LASIRISAFAKVRYRGLDEKRLLGNLAAVGRDTALYKQTLDKLGETEASITTLSTAIEKTAGEIETAKEQLQGFVSALIL